MADYLLVVDMQSDYVAVGKAYHEELTAAVNDKIATYPSDRVIYILNRFFWERKDRKENYQVSVDLSAVGVANQNKFQNTLYKWHSFGVTVKGELL